MLERTAARLEPCTLPRSWQSTVRPRRNLHTGFWQHGAAALDLSSIWTTSSGQAPPQQDATVPSERGLPEKLLTSAFLLDFLYPKGTVAFLRRLRPAAIDGSATSVARKSTGPTRLFASSARGVADTTDMNSLLERSVSGRSELADQSLEEQEEQGLLRKQEKTPAEHKQFLARLQTVVDPDAAHGAAMTPAILMRGLMARTDTEFYDDVWELWLMLDPEEKIDLRKELIQYLHHSLNALEAARVLDIFSEVDLPAWSPSQITAAVTAHLRRGEIEDALRVYEAGLQMFERGMPEIEIPLVGGMGHLLQYALRKSDWKLLTRIYDPWHKMSSPRTEKLPWGVMTPIFSVPNIGGRVLEFRERLASTAIDEDPQIFPEKVVPDPFAKDLNALPDLYPDKTPEQRLEYCGPLLDILAKLAIQQPCKPKDAGPLLRMINHGYYYNQYITEAIERGDTKAFSEVYRGFRQMSADHFKPSKETLTSILEVFVGYDVQGVEMVYEDFHTLHGGPNVTACIQLLNFYASRGDVESAQLVWNALVVEDKEALAKPGSFVPLLHARKIHGDAKAVRQLFDQMSTQYGVEPDVKCWNVLLTSVVAQGNVGDALKLFGQLRKAVTPNSYCFSTIMAMIAGRGDVDLTLLLFEDAKKLGIVIDAGIMATIVEAYTRAGNFDEGRRICVAAKVEGLPGDQAHLWNCLIRRKAHERDLRKVKAVVDEMKRRKIPWNTQTQEAVLQALCQAKRITEAYHLLHKEKDLPVTARHFSIVIQGAFQRKAWRFVLKLCDQMEEAGFIVSGTDLIARAKAEAVSTLYMGRDEDEANREMSRELIGQFQEMLQAQTPQQPLTAEAAGIQRVGDVVNDKPWIEFVHEAVETLVQVPDLPAIRKLLGMYTDAITATRTTTDPHDLPLPILESMMQAELLEGDHARVKETWKLAFNKARELGRPSWAKPGTILPVYKYSLETPLDIMQEIQLAEEDPAALLELITVLQKEGFALSSINWNKTCLRLAKLGEWVKACLLFERLLMPTWTGWKSMRLMLSNVPNNASYYDRLRGRSNEFPRPNSEALTFLVDEYHWMRRAALWDTSREAMLQTVADKCPRMMHAFRTALAFGPEGPINSNFHQNQTNTRHQQRSEKELYNDDDT